MSHCTADSDDTVNILLEPPLYNHPIGPLEGPIYPYPAGPLERPTYDSPIGPLERPLYAEPAGPHPHPSTANTVISIRADPTDSFQAIPNLYTPSTESLEQSHRDIMTDANRVTIRVNGLECHEYPNSILFNPHDVISDFIEQLSETSFYRRIFELPFNINTHTAHWNENVQSWKTCTFLTFTFSDDKHFTVLNALTHAFHEFHYHPKVQQAITIDNRITFNIVNYPAFIPRHVFTLHHST